MSQPMWKKGLLAAGWNLRTAVELAIEVEEMGRALYGRLARRWESNPALRELFTQLGDDEVAHQDGLRTLLADVANARSGTELDVEALRAIADASFFSSDGGILADLESLTTPQQVLASVVRFEKGTSLYFRGLRDVLGPSVTLDLIIAEEKRHAATVTRALDDFNGRDARIA